MLSRLQRWLCARFLSREGHRQSSDPFLPLRSPTRSGIAKGWARPQSYSPTTAGRIRAGSAPPFHSPLWSRRFLYGTHRGGVKNSVSHFVFGVGVRSCLLIHDSRLDPGETPETKNAISIPKKPSPSTEKGWRSRRASGTFIP